jgi:DNA mismatch endonuclease (patch repair protein)
MARIRGRNTKPEEILRRLVWARGLRYRLHLRIESCRPDLVFRAPRVAVFVDGCFWHGCPDHYVRPRSRDRFWHRKLVENVERDIRQTAALEEKGWRVCRIWEHRVFEDPHGATNLVEAAVREESWQPARAFRVIGVESAGGTRDLERRHLRELRGRARQRAVFRKRSTKKWVIHESLK